MKADAAPILGLFEKKARLDVPLYQRQYVWKRETHWEPLWEDIERKFNDSIHGESDGPVHFLGAMVLDQKQTPSTHVEKRTVIDGQQRLTTFQLFIAAFRDYCNEFELIDQAKEFGRFNLNEGMMVNRDEEKYKLWPTQVDRQFFKDVIDAGSKKNLELKYPEVREKRARKPNARHLMVEGYLYFYEVIGVYLTEILNEFPQLTIQDVISQCLLALKQSLKVVVIDLDQDDDPQVIFETLNARGEPLLPGDLLRNYVFLKVAREGKDSAQYYETYWRRFEDEFWRTEIRQGRMTRPRGDVFLQTYLSLNANRDISIKHLFVEYKHWVDRGSPKPFKNTDEELVSYNLYADAFEQFEKVKVSDSRYDFLNAFDIGTASPLFVELIASNVSSKAYSEIMHMVESYIIRRNICDSSQKNYNRVFLSAAKVARDSKGDMLAIKSVLEGTDKALWPTDKAIEYSVENDNIYGRVGSLRLQYIFKKIEQSLRNSKTENVVVLDGLTIEHIMPQKWQDNWPIKNNEIIEDKRERIIGTIGNLTILTQPLNASVSNSAWVIKQAEIEKQSLLKLNQEVIKNTTWTDQLIIERSRKLASIITNIWK